MPAILVFFLIVIILPCIFAFGIMHESSKIFSRVIYLFSAGFWFALIIALLAVGEPTIKDIKTYSIIEIPTPNNGKAQIAFVEGKLINITKLKNILFENPKERRLEVTTYNQCQNWICQDDTALENKSTYKVIMAENNNVQIH